MQIIIISKTVFLLIPTLRIIGNFSAGKAEFTDYLISHDKFFEACLLMLNNSKTSVVRETAWLLSNLAAGNK